MAERRNPKRIIVLSAESCPSWEVRAKDVILLDKDARRALKIPSIAATPEERAEWQEADSIVMAEQRKQPARLS